jgi:beta-glucanase (GH16 family)
MVERYLSKTVLLFFVILVSSLFCFHSFAQQNQYIDLHPNQTLINPPIKSGWNLVFNDEFNGSKDSMWQSDYCAGDLGFPSYYTTANYSFDNSSIHLITKKENGLSAPYGFVTKYYSSALLSTDACTNDTIPAILPNGETWKYGYFEIRCKNPKSQLMWPAFWLIGERNSHSAWNEIDVFEFGVGDGLVMTNHYGYGGRFISRGIATWLYSLPGQTFGDTWVTYGMKWEPDRIIWYINNVPVRVQTDQDSVLIPNSAMHLVASTGLSFGNIGSDLNLPLVLPNDMQIDYIRVYQRNDYTLPEPVFTINNQQSFNSHSPVILPFNNGLPVYIDASQSYMPNRSYFLSVQNCDTNGTLIGTEAMSWLDSTQVDSINQFDINAFALSHGLNLSSGSYYRIKLAGTSPWTEVNQYIYLSPCNDSSVIRINGNNTTLFLAVINIPNNFFKPRIILDASNSISCNDSFFISVQQCDVNGTISGTKVSEWLSNSEKKYLSCFDVEYFCNQHNFFLQYGNYYLIKFGSGDSLNTLNQILYILPCTNTISFSINGDSSVFPNAISISNGTDIILDGTASNFCNNEYNVSVQQCDINGNALGNQVSEWSPYMTTPSPYYYTIGRYDIRSLCAKNNYNLDCGSYYRVTLMAGDTLTNLVKIIYIEPCITVNDSFTVWGIDNPLVHCSSPCPSPDCCSGREAITLYAPDIISCNESYFVSIQKMDHQLNLIGLAAERWLTFDEIYQLKTLGVFNLRIFAMTPNGNDTIAFGPDATYRIKLISGTGSCNSDSLNEYDKIIYLGAGTPITMRNDSSLIMKVYPNPADDNIAVSVPFDGTPINLKLISIEGKVIKNVSINNELTIINLSGIDSGLYILQAILKDRILVGKVQVIEHK